MLGKQVRLSRITSNGKMLCIPMDHGISIGPVKGLDTISDTIQQVQDGGATTFLAHKGILKSLKWVPEIGIIMHVNGSTDIGLAPNRKMMVANVREAVKLGADAVSIHINIGGKEEPEMLNDLGYIAEEADEFEIPLIAMMYPRGEGIDDPYDTDTVAHAARIGAELGADVVKTLYTGSADSFKKVVNSCPVPVVIAGGSKANNDRDLLQLAKDVMSSGAMCVTFGRNVFQHVTPRSIVRGLSKVVLDGYSVDDALEASING